MKTMKTLLAVILAVCLVMSLSIPAFATETTAPAATTTAPTEDTADVSEEVEEPVADEAPAPEDVDAEGAHDHDHDHEEEAVEEPGWKKTVRVILTVLEVLASIALAAIVLMQSGKESGLSGAISGNSDSYMSKGGKGGMDKMLAKSTKWVALTWLLLTLALSLI